MVKIEDIKVTEAIIKKFSEDLLKHTKVDVVVAGAGPAGMTTARYLAKEGVKVVVFERKLSVGGGMWGGGMLFPDVVIQEKAKDILTEVNVKLDEMGKGYSVADSVEAVTKIAAAAIDAGAKIFNAINVEDVVIRENDRVAGAVVNWTAVELANLHVDPVSIESRYVVDATGHDCEITQIVQRKIPGAKLNTKTGKIIGEKPMYAEVGETKIVEYTGEVYPGLVLAGMAVNAVHGLPRMGPIFGGMLLSGKRAAEVILEKL